jgi:PAS domain-containing protein
MEGINNIPCLYFSASSPGVITEVNEMLCRVLGYTGQELVGQKVEKIFTLSTRIFQQTHLFPLLQMKGEAEEIFMTLLTKEKKAGAGSDQCRYQYGKWNCAVSFCWYSYPAAAEIRGRNYRG